jgi:uncharacterized protein YbaR (Trm112 family)/ubiquinone/menaquinone biosynthesis C-methylase UbiE
MKASLLPLLACPGCRQELTLSPDAVFEAGEVATGTLRCTSCARGYPVRDGIPRFVPEQNYAGSFGFQWNRFEKTQLDEHWGAPLSERRFFEETRWPRRMDGQVIVEAGSGAGRFTPHAASTGATVVSLDYSRAIEANRRTNGRHANVHFLQADLRALPLKNAVADKLYCLGVLQHTPEPEQSFRALLPALKPGGEVVFDVYRLSWRALLYGRYWLRPVTKRIPPETLFPLVEKYVAVLYPLLGALRAVVGQKALILANLLGVYDYRGIFDLAPDRLRELCLLDTFDALSPAHDHPQTVETIARWLAEARLDRAEASPGYNGVEGRGVKR